MVAKNSRHLKIIVDQGATFQLKVLMLRRDRVFIKKLREKLLALKVCSTVQLFSFDFGRGYVNCGEVFLSSDLRSCLFPASSYTLDLSLSKDSLILNELGYKVVIFPQRQVEHSKN